MRRPASLLPLLLMLCFGCGPSRQQAQYGWLRKQGPRMATSAPEVRGKGNVPGEERSDGVVSADIARHSAVVLAAPAKERAEDAAPGPHAMGSAVRDTMARMDSIHQDTSYYSVQHHPWSAKAIASLPIAVATVVIGLATQSIYLLLIGGAISFVLGLVASRQCRDRGDHGKGFAILAMVLGAAALFLSLMVLITAA